jgi:hypothetical protein
VTDGYIVDFTHSAVVADVGNYVRAWEIVIKNAVFISSTGQGVI